MTIKGAFFHFFPPVIGKLNLSLGNIRILWINRKYKIFTPQSSGGVLPHTGLGSNEY